MIDELNNIVTKEEKSDFYAEYFGVMELPEEEIEERIELANKFETHFYFILSLILADSLNNELKENEYYTNILLNRYRNVVDNFYETETKVDSYMNLLSYSDSESIVDTTILNIADDYYTSEDRAMNISANETNSVANYYRELRMIKEGYTRKTWKCRMDGKERMTHKIANGQTVGIFEPFHVGESLLMFPHDESLGSNPKEIIHCRCVTKYFK